jgi:hypothetical protein
MKQKIMDEIFERIMEAVRSAFIEEDRIVESFKEQEGIPEDAIIINKDSNMIFDLIEDRVLNAVHETIGDMIKDGDITVNED